jgi:hypothetical protein
VLKFLRSPVWILLGAAVLGSPGCMTHPWFKSRWPWEEPPDPNQQPILTNSAGETYRPGTPSWVPLIDDCMRAGGDRNDCIDALPPEELEKFQEWERARGRRQLLEKRTKTDMGYFGCA